VIVVGVNRRRALSAAAASLVSLVVLVCASSAFAGTVGWTVRTVAVPSNFSAGDAQRCEAEGKCDRYQLLVTNVGDEASSGPITLTDTLPVGITTLQTPESENYSGEGMPWSCTPGAGNAGVTCTFPESVPVGGYAPFLDIVVSAPSASISGMLRNEASVTGGGTVAVTSGSVENPVSSQTPAFGVSEFGVEPMVAGGTASTQAGAHPWALTASIGIPSFISAPGEDLEKFSPVENLKSAAVELPLGLVGDPQATPQRCTETELVNQACPASSRVGSFAVLAGGFVYSEFYFTGGGTCCSAIYNMVPQGGYPAEFAFAFAGVPVYLHAGVVHTASGYRLRVATQGIPSVLETEDIALTFFGDPGALNGGPSGRGLLTNPTDCSAGPLSSRVELESWEHPGHPVSREAVMYPQLSGCDLLQFDPSLSLAPSVGEGGTTQADEPSGYTVDLKVPQSSGFSQLATPALKDVSVTLPEGLAISPGAADGLAGCEEAQIDLASTSAGACPSNSQIGTAEALTPILPDPLQGRVFLATPKCGGAGQAACTPASASDGDLFGLYLEVDGPGFVLKFPGTVSADPATGRLTAHFKDLIQQPVSEVKLHLKSGPRAPLANPQTCGQASTTSDLTPWSTPTTADAISTSSFNVDWDGNGGACPASLPFNPAFTAGTVMPQAAAFSPFTLTFSRQDREQDLSGLSVQLPPGLLGSLKSVERCPEPQASQGACGAGSLIGHTTVAAGAGSHPFNVGGQVFLTGPYNGAPFGLSIVVPAVAGPFNLGNVIVRAAIHVDPHTAQITVVADPLPQLVDGVPLRIQTVNVTVDRPGFTFNPTSCVQQQVTGTIAAAQGASANVSSPFALAGCKSLAFKPSFSVSTQAKTSKRNGASLDVKVGYPTGQANIRGVAVTLPKQLPSRLTTIQQACPQATFAANPASCPAGSNIGTAIAITPVLSSPLSGPAYLVSHGGAAFPDLVVVLQGEGVTLDLIGSIDIKKGVTSSTFASVPDAPVSSFELKLPEGPHSGLAAVVPAKAKGNLCGQALKMPTTITGQNGAAVKQTTKIKITGCPKAKPTRRAHGKKKAKQTRSKHRAGRAQANVKKGR
jgi:hypothetical protein